MRLTMNYIISIVLFSLSFAVQAAKPEVGSFASVTADGSYKEGDSINITATINQTVNAGSDLTVVLDTGVSVDLTNAVSSTELVGLYIVGSGENSSDLNVSSFSIGIDGVVGSGGSMKKTNLPASNLANTSNLVVDTTVPSASLVYSIGGSAVSSVKSGDTVRIIATFNEAVADSPAMQISGSGVTTVGATNMTKTSTTSYYYDWSVGSGNGTQTFALATGTDVAGNVITTSPTSGATITVDNTLPVIISGDTTSVAENQTSAIDVNATDANTIAYSISGGDSALFSINSSGVVVFNSAPDYELPGDSDVNNTYTFTVTATDVAGNAGTQLITITVTDAAFTVDAISNANVNEGSIYTGVTPSISGDAPVGSLTYVLSGDDSGDFTINASTGVVSMVARDYENPVDLDLNNVYALTITATDSASNSDAESWTVSVIDTDDTPPTVTFSPANGATDVANATGITLTFDEAIREADGSTVKNNELDDIITLKNTSSGGADIGFSASINGAYQVITITPGNNFTDGQVVYVAVNANTVEDGEGNTITSTPSASFTIVDNTSPTLSSSVPLDNATGVLADSNITLTFSESVVVNTGNIYIKKTSDDSTVETISVTSGQVTGSGSTTITVNPSVTLASTTEYYVAIDSTAFDDNAGNSYAGINSTTALSFTTVDTVAPTVTFDPANSATGVANNAHIEINFNEVVQLLGGVDIVKSNGNGNTQVYPDIKELITLKDTDANGADIPFSVITHTHTYPQIEVYPDSPLGNLQKVYLSIDAGLQDTSGNVISATSTSFTAGVAPHYTSSYPTIFQKNIGIDANIVLNFDRVVYASTTSAGGRSDRFITIYNADTSTVVFSEQSNSAYVSGSGTTQISVNPPNDLEERVNYYVLIGDDAFYDADNAYYPGISDNDSLAFMTAKDPNKYIDVTAANEAGVNHSMNQAEKSINVISNRQNFIRRNGGKNKSSQGIKFKFNNEKLDTTLNKLAPLINHFEQYDVSTQLANAADKALPNGWGLWTSGEISIGDTNSKNGSDGSTKSKEISLGLDKVIDTGRILGGSYRINETETHINSSGTKMDSSTKTWSLYGSLKTSKRNTLEGLVGVSNISTDHTRVDGVNTYTGIQKSEQAFICLIARESYDLEEADLSPFIRVDSSYTKQQAYSETGDSGTAYDALHYKASNFHNSIISVGADVDTEYQVGDKTVKPYLSLRHKMNTGYESSNVMYYLSNPIKEYTQNITSNSNDSGFNLVVGADISSEDGWLITGSYELSESDLTFNKSLRFRAELKF